MPPRGGRTRVESPLGACQLGCGYSRSRSSCFSSSSCFRMYSRIVRSSYRSHAIATRPEVHPLGPMSRHQLPMDPNCTLPLQKPDHERYAVLRCHLQTHVHMVRSKGPFQYLHTPLSTQIFQDPSYIPPKLPVQRPPPILRDDDHVILAVPAYVG